MALPSGESNVGRSTRCAKCGIGVRREDVVRSCKRDMAFFSFCSQNCLCVFGSGLKREFWDDGGAAFDVILKIQQRADEPRSDECTKKNGNH